MTGCSLFFRRLSILSVLLRSYPIIAAKSILLYHQSHHLLTCSAGKLPHHNWLLVILPKTLNSFRSAEKIPYHNWLFVIIPKTFHSLRSAEKLPHHNWLLVILQKTFHSLRSAEKLPHHNWLLVILQKTFNSLGIFR
ncbi:hypothetical protein AVEN_265344-1 [Araneus ventricosus]|uniref:Secreted protein n=1 Tax=Araneus ventricosus TaxID=182803 RepID=A0A4Y2LMH8_ARAVE|nr:hypothetical protein AVEN_265344-1 [Araneus ventricosus]